MHPNEHFLKQYDDLIKSYAEKGELWRMKMTREEFEEKLEAFRKQEAQDMLRKDVNLFSIQSNIEASISILLMPIMTMEEIKAHFKRNKEITDAYFAEAAPQIKKEIQKLDLPLDRRKMQKICAALFRKQIIESDIPEAIYEELKETRMFISIKKRMEQRYGTL